VRPGFGRALVRGWLRQGSSLERAETIFGSGEPPARYSPAERRTLREMLDHHLVVVIGSDYAGPNPETAASSNPFIPLYYYVSRKTRDGHVLGPHEKISREEALRIATYNNAFATWEEKVKGSIEPGKPADFLVLSRDFMTIPEDEIVKFHPMATYVGGRKVYPAPEANGAF
jgi:predicted amidohydrolase YtcJ